VALVLSPSSYRQQRAHVLSVLARRCGWLDDTEREGLLHDAYAVILEKQRAGLLDLELMHPAQLRAYLTQTALHKALDESKRACRRRSAPLEDGTTLLEEDEPLPEERLAVLMDRLEVRELLADLPERQRTIVGLRFYYDQTPEEIRRQLAVSSRVYRREFERGMRTLAEALQAVRETGLCEARRSLVLAYAFGVAGPGRAEVARRHIAACSFCARWVAELRDGDRPILDSFGSTGAP
jgi:RNA polymerase sigma factor (sigma-70 family)